MRAKGIQRTKLADNCIRFLIIESVLYCASSASVTRRSRYCPLMCTSVICCLHFSHTRTLYSYHSLFLIRGSLWKRAYRMHVCTLRNRVYNPTVRVQSYGASMYAPALADTFAAPPAPFSLPLYRITATVSPPRIKRINLIVYILGISI